PVRTRLDRRQVHPKIRTVGCIQIVEAKNHRSIRQRDQARRAGRRVLERPELTAREHRIAGVGLADPCADAADVGNASFTVFSMKSFCG
ncbi:MAG TPA: hypothetical protein VM600_05140, partial [Actinomycetota bacterium]|nr:hypothetical protein [Actinomycetota bacterium]